jgi:hypothetical protein
MAGRLVVVVAYPSASISSAASISLAASSRAALLLSGRRFPSTWMHFEVTGE